MVGGTTPPQDDSDVRFPESWSSTFSGEDSGARAPPRTSLSLTTPSLLSRGTRQEEYALKETFIGLPIYATFVVLDESEKDEKGTPKLCILDAIPERVQNNKEFLEYHRRCMNKLITNWRDSVVHRKRGDDKYHAS